MNWTITNIFRFKINFNNFRGCGWSRPDMEPSELDRYSVRNSSEFYKETWPIQSIER